MSVITVMIVMTVVVDEGWVVVDEWWLMNEDL